MTLARSVDERQHIDGARAPSEPTPPARPAARERCGARAPAAARGGRERTQLSAWNTRCPTSPMSQAPAPDGRRRWRYGRGNLMAMPHRARPHASRRRQRPRAHDPPRRLRRRRRRAADRGALDRLVDARPVRALRPELPQRRPAPAHQPPPRARERHRDRDHARPARRRGRRQRRSQQPRAALAGAARRDGRRALSPPGRRRRDRAHGVSDSAGHARRRSQPRPSTTPSR